MQHVQGVIFLVLAVNSDWFQILQNYTLTQPPFLCVLALDKCMKLTGAIHAIHTASVNICIVGGSL